MSTTTIVLLVILFLGSAIAFTTFNSEQLIEWFEGRLAKAKK